MSLPIWQQSKPERAAAVQAAFAGMVPAERKVPTVVEQLRTIRGFVVQKRSEGYTVEQICTALQHPGVAINASVASVRRILKEAVRRRDQRRKAREAALLASVAAGAANASTRATTGKPTR